MATKLYVLGFLGLLVALSCASYDYDNIVNFQSPDQELHHRAKRAADYPVSPTNPANVTFIFGKIGEHENAVAMSVGEYARLRLIIQFPVGTTDMLVELFTPDNTTTVMKLCSPVVTQVGSALTVNVNGTVWDMAKINENIKKEGKTATTKDYDRAIIPLGNVTAAAATTLSKEATITIEWEAVMIFNALVINGTIYWVSVGAEYNKEGEVFIAQASFEAITDSWTPPDSPSANYTGPSTMECGSSGEFKVDLFIPHPSVSLTFDAFAPLNHSGVMSVCSIAITDTGPNYNCLDREKKYTLYPANNTKGNERGRLVLGVVTNKNAKKKVTADGRITVSFVMYLYDSPTCAGKDYWIGAALEIGTTQIWAGQLKITTTAKVFTHNMAFSPTFSLGVNGSTIVAIGDTVSLDLNITVPKNDAGRYELEALAPYNASAPQMRICKIVAVYNGANVPCLPDTETVLLARDNDTKRADRATKSLELVNNFGHFVESPTFVNPDLMRLAVAFEVLEHSLNTPGANSWPTLGVTYTKLKLWVAQVKFSVATTPPNASSGGPSFLMYFKNSTENLAKNQSAKIHLEMITTAGSKYLPMEMEAIMPFENNLAMVKVCRIEIIHVGKNFPCFDQAKHNSSFNLTSKNNDTTKPDKALITLGQVSNMGYSNDEMDNKIIFELVIEVQEHPLWTHGLQRWVSFGIMYKATTIWVGQLQITMNLNSPPTLATAPHIVAIRENDPGNMNVAIGDCVVYDLLVKVPPLESSKIIVTATGSANLKVCSIRVKEAGTNLPCVRTDLNSTTVGSTTTLDLYMVTNIAEEAMVSNSTYDNNTMRIQVIAQLSWNSGVAAGSTHNLDLKVDNGANAGWPNLPQLTFTATGNLTVNSTNATNPSFTFNVYSVDDVNHTQVPPAGAIKMAKGEAKKFHLLIRPKNNTVNRMEVKFLTPVNSTGEMEICTINVLHVGLNMPCNKREMYNLTGFFHSRYNSPFNDIAGVDLGYVCHRPLFNNTEESQITVEAVGKLLPNSSYAVGAEFFLSATVKLNDDQIYVTQTKLAVMNMNDFSSTVVNASLGGVKIEGPLANTLLSWRPGSNYTVPFSLEIPPNSSVIATVQVSTPMGTTAIMTVKHLKITGTGANIGCIRADRTKDEYPLSLNSTAKTTQMDRAYFPLYVVSNSGASYRINNYTADHNKIFLEVLIQMADAVENDKDSQFEFTLSGRAGSAIWLYKQKVAVLRDNAEEPKLNLTLTSDQTPTYDKLKFINITAMLYHEFGTTGSSAESRNLEVAIYYPKVLKFVALNYCNHTPTPTTELITTPNNGVKLKFGQFLFTDKANCSFALGVDDQASLPSGSGATPDIVAVYEARCTKLHRTGDTFASGYVFSTAPENLSYKIQPASSAGCVSTERGMKDGTITDCQISGSESPDNTKTQAKGRLGSTTGYWMMANRQGPYENYLSVKLGNRTRVTQVILEHPGADKRIGKFQIQSSNDGITWTGSEEVTPATNYGTTVNNLTTPVEGRYVRILVTDKDGGADATVSARVEFSGCTTLGDVSITDVCKQKPWDSLVKATEFVSRGFLVTGSTVFLCNVMDKEGTMKCFSNDGSSTWKGLDKEIVNVIGVLPSKNLLFGLASDKRSYVESEDSGATFVSISKARFDKQKTEAGFVSHLEVPYVKDASVSDTPSATFTVGTRGVGYPGYYSSGVKKADWTTCCAP